ncbi:MAG: trigger factor [Magnetococcales bacterium]|nr:trigger factor [Magnetococcales bacterium]
MDVTVEEKGQFDRSVTVRIPAERVAQMMDVEVQRLAQSVRLPGFRPGKAPKKMLESRYQGQIVAEVGERLVESTYSQALRDNDLRPVGPPELEVGKLSREDGFSYTAVVQVMPTMTPEGYKDLKLTRLAATIEEADVDRVIEEMRRSNAEFEMAEGRAAEKGDQVVLDFEGFVDDEPFEGGASEKYVLTLGENRFIPGFEEQLEGAKADQDVDVKVTFPEKYHSSNLAGKEAIFKCKVHEVRTPELPEVDDDFAKASGGVEEGGVEALRQKVQERLVKEAEKKSRQLLRSEIMDQLLEANRTELPDQLVDQEAKALIDRIKGEYKNQGVDPEAMKSEQEWMDEYRDSAMDRVILGMTVGAISREESIGADEEELSAHLDKMIEETVGEMPGVDPERMKAWFREDKERMGEVESRLVEEKIIEWIVDHGEMSDENISLEELLNKGTEG